MPGDLGEGHGSSKTAPLWQAKPSPLFYVLLRNDAEWLGTLFCAAVLLVLLHPERSLGAIGIMMALLFICGFIASLWAVYRLARESKEVVYEFDGNNLIERIGEKTNKTSFLHYTLAKSRHYCIFGHCCFHFQEGRAFWLPGSQPDPTLAYKRQRFFHESRTDEDSGKGIFGIRKADADRLYEVLQTVDV